MSKTIRFKVYLTRENICGEVVTTEIRRFNMADDKTLTFDKIEGWLKHVFPDVSWVDAKITWKGNNNQLPSFFGSLKIINNTCLFNYRHGIRQCRHIYWSRIGRCCDRDEKPKLNVQILRTRMYRKNKRKPVKWGEDQTTPGGRVTCAKLNVQCCREYLISPETI